MDPLIVYGHADEIDGRVRFTRKRMDNEDLRYPHVSPQDAEQLREIANDYPPTADSRVLLLRLAGGG